MRLSISASSLISCWRRFSSRAAASAFVAWLRGSGGGMRGQHACFICASSSSAAPASLRSCAARPRSASPDLGQRRGRQRRGGAALVGFAAAGQGGLGDGLRLVRPSRCVLALTRITSSGVSWNTRLKPSGSTKRTVSRTACTAKETPSAICRVLNDAGSRRRIIAAATAASFSPVSVDIDGDGNRAGRRFPPRCRLPPASTRLGRGIQALDHRAARRPA